MQIGHDTFFTADIIDERNGILIAEVVLESEGHCIKAGKAKVDGESVLLTPDLETFLNTQGLDRSVALDDIELACQGARKIFINFG
jgi:hypothetical protein